MSDHLSLQYASIDESTLICPIALECIESHRLYDLDGCAFDIVSLHELLVRDGHDTRHPITRTTLARVRIDHIYNAIKTYYDLPHVSDVERKEQMQRHDWYRTGLFVPRKCDGAGVLVCLAIMGIGLWATFGILAQGSS